MLALVLLSVLAAVNAASISVNTDENGSYAVMINDEVWLERFGKTLLLIWMFSRLCNEVPS